LFKFKKIVNLNVLRLLIFSTLLLLSFEQFNFARIQVQTYKLKNGLNVILSPIEGIKSVSVFTYYKTGVRDDPVEFKGVSTIFKNIRLNSATKNFNYLEGVLYVKNKGGIVATKIAYDYSYFYQIIAEEDLNIALMLESERFKSLKINNRGFLIQKNRHIQKLERLAKYNGYYEAYLWINAKLFANSIYQYSLMGTSLKLKNLKLSDIKSVYKRYSNPQLATLVISGEFDTVEVKKTINKYFSDIRAVRDVKLKYSSFNFINDSVSKSLVAAKNAENFIIIGIPAPSVLNYNFIHFLFMKYFLFDERIGNIENLLKNKNNLDITMDYKLTDNIEANSLILGISSNKKIDVIRARYLILKYINNLPITMLKKKKDIQRIKRLMEIDYLKNLSGLLSRSEVLAKSEHFFGDIDVNKNILRKIKNINLLSLVNVCKRYFVKNKMVMLFEYNDD